MRLTAVPCDFDGSGMYRIAFPFAALRARGHECALPLHHRPIESYLSANAETDGVLRVEFTGLDRSLPRTRAELVVLQRPVDSGMPAIIRYVKEKGMRVVVETDDWIAGLPGWNPAFHRLSAKHSSTRNAQVFGQCCALADLVTASTPALAEGYRRFNQNTLVIRNYLEASMWQHPTVLDHRPWDRVRVGYMGDPRWHAGDLRVLSGVLGPWLERNPDVDFAANVYEADKDGTPHESTFDILGVPEDRRVPLGNVPFRSLRLHEVTAQMDIGLVPLADHPFNEGKSHLKGMEYAACGIPCVASPTESYRHWIEPGVNGFLARHAREWTRALDALLDETIRRRMGAAAREKAMRHTIDRHIDEYENAYLTVLNQSERVLA